MQTAQKFSILSIARKGGQNTAKYIEHLTVKELEDVLEHETRTAILPVGIVEQHGYHLPLGTDMYNTSEFLRLSQDRYNAVILPALNYCFSGGDLTGTMNIDPQLFGAFVADICAECVRNGFKNIVAILGHGGTDNQIALKNSLQMFLRRNPQYNDITLSLVPIWHLSKTWLDNFNRKPEADFHAGLVETSLMMFWKPELVKDEIVEDDPEVCKMLRSDQDWFEKREKLVDHEFVVEKVSQKEEVRIGVMGFPHEATAEIGKKIFEEAADEFAKFIELFNNR